MSVSNSKRTGAWVDAMLAPLVVFVLAYACLLLLAYGAYLLLLHLALWLVWGPWGRRVLFVYSNSPVWQDHVERNVLPRLPANAVILNWSERSRWNRWTLSSQAFSMFGGSREFNPMAIVIQPFQPTKCFRFWKAFRDYKHGKPQALEKVESEFFEQLKRVTPRRAA